MRLEVIFDEFGRAGDDRAAVATRALKRFLETPASRPPQYLEIRQPAINQRLQSPRTASAES